MANHKKTISFNEYLIQLFGHDEGEMAKTVTIQVTDACNLACTYCPAPGTKLLTPEGKTVLIEDVRPGDYVLGFTEEGEREPFPAKVLETYNHKVNELLHITMKDGRSIRITPEHKVVDGNNEWVEVGKVKDSILSYSNGIFYPEEIANIEHLTGDFTVYNIATESRTYIAEGLAVHNCYQINKHNHFIPIETGKKFIDDLLTGKYNNYCDYDNCQGIILEFIGGEPFMAIDQVSELTDYFIQRLAEMNHKWLNRYKISICSNGVLYFDPKVQEYIAKHLNHLSFNISVDGNKELHDACRIFPDGAGSYDIAMKAVEDFRERYHGYMGSKMTIAPDNIMHTFQAVKDFIASGYDDIHLNTVYEEGWTTEHAKILYDQLKQTADYLLESGHCEDTELSIFNEHLFAPIAETHNSPYCGGSGSMLAVDWKGDLYPCIRYMESSIGNELEPLIIGNVENGIMATSKQCDKVNCLKCITRRSMSNDECFYCPIGSGCGCCTAYNYQYYGDADKRTTFGCIMHKARSLANAYYWNKYHILHGDNTRFKIHIPDEWALEIIDENELAMLKFFENYVIEK